MNILRWIKVNRISYRVKFTKRLPIWMSDNPLRVPTWVHLGGCLTGSNPSNKLIALIKALKYMKIQPKLIEKSFVVFLATIPSPHLHCTGCAGPRFKLSLRYAKRRIYNLMHRGACDLCTYQCTAQPVIEIAL